MLWRQSHKYFYEVSPATQVPESQTRQSVTRLVRATELIRIPF